MSRPLPEVGAPGRLPALAIDEFRLTCGVPVYVVPRHGVPIVDVDVVFMVGAVMDDREHGGRVSMTCEMLDEGTRTRNALQIAEEMDYLGGYLDIQPAFDSITISTHIQSSRLARALELLADVTLQPGFETHEFERKRGEHERALRQELDEADIVAAKALATGVFGPSHPYGVPISGTCASLARLTRDETRQFWEDHLHAGNAFVVVTGDVDERIIDTLEASLGALRERPATSMDRLMMPEQPTRRILLVDKPGAAQAELRVGHTAPPRSIDDYFALMVMNSILGGAFTSRLNTILRERMGVTYGASSRFRLRKGGGIFSAGAAVFTEAAARSAEVVVEEMSRMIDERVGAEELRRAQSYIALGLPRSFETTQDIAAHVREQVVYELGNDYWSSYVDRIFAVTAEEVADAAARHLHPDRCTIAIAADASQVRDALEKTNLGPVVMTNVEA